MGRNERAIVEIKLARELDPLKPHINLEIAYIFYFARQYDSALEQYEIGQELDPDFSATYYGKGFVYAARGKYLEAINNYKEMIRLNGAHTGVDCYLGFALARAGQISEARTILNELETGKEYVSPVELAVLHVGLDEPDKALSSLEKAYVAQDSQLQYLSRAALRQSAI
jgi:tetratricopeptide (TPR) repeat protein